ncbi:MAG: thioredoxin domain-containing protein, partial [bacterium]
MTAHPPNGATEKGHNRLVREQSPYLLQHAGNPVDWFPWGEEAFEKAAREHKPIFLSIGYSTCHWCHVMARESFEDPEIASMLNDAFVCIKVDREERPDIDKVYMAVCQMMTGSGGWPLTVILTPDKTPFFAGTYIPKESRFGMAGLRELIPQITTLWNRNHDRVIAYAGQVAEVLRKGEEYPMPAEPDESMLDAAYESLVLNFDSRFGGFGRAPKFPSPHTILFLLRYWKRKGVAASLGMAEKTLQAMRRGGIYDQVGFGIHRYSTDSQWFVPHFEKMLYDQALVAMAYTEAYQATGNEGYASTAREIFTYVLRDMAAPGGGFYAAEDAESEGEEGKFYLWTTGEVQRLLPQDDAELVIRVFNLSEGGNFNPSRTRTNILRMRESLHDIAGELNAPVSEIARRMEKAREVLFHARQTRVRPARDDTVLTDWNGLMIAALAKGGRVFDEPAYTDAARSAADFILGRMRTPEGRLLHRYRDDSARITGYLDDYAFLIWGMLELFETTFTGSYLQSALHLYQDLERHYWDSAAGGFYFTPDDGEGLMVRQKEIYDGAVPSGNAASMMNLLRLARITGDSRFEEKAAAIGRAFSQRVGEVPQAYPYFMVAVDFGLGPSCEVVVAGRSDAPDTQEMLGPLRRHFIPHATVLFRPTDQESPEIDTLSPFAAS